MASNATRSRRTVPTQGARRRRRWWSPRRARTRRRRTARRPAGTRIEPVTRRTQTRRSRRRGERRRRMRSAGVDARNRIRSRHPPGRRTRKHRGRLGDVHRARERIESTPRARRVDGTVAGVVMVTVVASPRGSANGDARRAPPTPTRIISRVTSGAPRETRPRRRRGTSTRHASEWSWWSWWS